MTESRLCGAPTRDGSCRNRTRGDRCHRHPPEPLLVDGDLSLLAELLAADAPDLADLDATYDAATSAAAEGHPQR